MTAAPTIGQRLRVLAIMAAAALAPFACQPVPA